MKKITTSVLVLVLLVLCQTVFAQDNYINYLQRARQRLEEGDCDAAQRNYAAYHELTDKSDREVELLIEECKGGGLTGTANGHEYVDLGLPSGTLWATCNVGDSRYGCSGQYYAWGEVENKNSFDWYSYKYAILNHYQGEFVRLTKYCNKSEYSTNGYIDNLINLQSVDDPAARWGDGWHTPSISQWTELLQHTTNCWVTQQGLMGRLFTGNNGRTIFLPALYVNENDKDYYGYYWSSSLFTDNPENAWSLYISSNKCYRKNLVRYYPGHVRPVRDNK